jgi:hypothetical protein
VFHETASTWVGCCTNETNPYSWRNLNLLKFPQWYTCILRRKMHISLYWFPVPLKYSASKLCFCGLALSSNVYSKSNIHLCTNCEDAAASAEKQRLPEYTAHNIDLWCANVSVLPRNRHVEIIREKSRANEKHRWHSEDPARICLPSVKPLFHDQLFTQWEG